ncbi:Hypothetical protein I595_2258 [Croceitalea dokdonensis DOKDO 023]|uniref:Uncharacterized protein n=1 Tax=Croceitalea dokdonensis DOKDO 023 TaxID=1300341 RepID=A0A0P7AV31_9FLAO|nr:Hypothetical protein I595_2258 [Croceitalea dokdonensis DOKDO 023]
MICKKFTVQTYQEAKSITTTVLSNLYSKLTLDSPKKTLKDNLQ